MGWYIKSYEVAVGIMHTARSPKVNGKPLNTFMRMYDMGTHLSAGVQRHSHYAELFRITPDNVLTFTADVHTIRRNAASLTWKLRDVCPVSITRTAKFKYSVTTEGKEKNVSNYHQGLKLNLSTLSFDNPKLDTDLVETSEDWAKWRKALSDWRKGLIVRYKVGAFDGIIRHYQEWATAPTRGLSTPFGPFTKSSGEAIFWANSLHVGASPWLDLLSSSMKEGKYPPLLITGLMHLGCRMGYRFAMAYPGQLAMKAHILSGFNRFISENRTEIKKRFGVLHDPNENRSGDTPSSGVDPS